MTGVPAEILGLLVLALTLGAAVVRPRGLGEWVAAVPGALVLLAVGAVDWRDGLHRLGMLAPTVTFLAFILLFGQLCADEGVFDYLGGLAARRSDGRSRRLLVIVVALAAVVTAVLTLDATVVLLTPVVVRTTRRLQVPGRPHLYACTHLANSASLLLPVSNLTNLLAVSQSHLSFGRFAELMALPWVLVCVLEWGALRIWFRGDLPPRVAPQAAAPPAPRAALVVLGLTVAGFVLTSSVGVVPAWAAAAGCAVLGVPRLLRRTSSPREVAGALNIGFCVFVLALGIVVDAVTRHGLAAGLRHVLPHGTGLVALLAVAGVSALLANVVNNLPATLALIPLTVTAGTPLAGLAVLLGVNIGPNATYPGSLATLLWRRMLPESDRPRAAEFHRLGLASVPVILAASTVALWIAGRLLGAG